MRSELKMLLAGGGLYACYITYGILQERLFRPDEDGNKFNFTLFLLFVQCIFNLLVAVVCRLVVKENHKPLDAQFHKWAIQIGFTYIGAMLCSNEALKYVSYPTQVLAKSSKMVPVMFMGVLLRGTVYTAFEYLCVFMITGGIALFQLFRAGKGGSGADSSVYGLALLLVSLLLDGATGPTQEKVFAKYGINSHHMMFNTNLYALVFLAVGLLYTGESPAALAYIQDHPSLVKDITLFSLCSGVGQIFIFYIVTEFNSLVLATVTTTRKFFTILASVALFGHQLAPLQWLGVCMAFGGLGGNIYSKKLKKEAKAAQAEAAAKEKNTMGKHA